ncbi:MAG: helix-turn-helix transcriptional regulator [Candidatus Omnitrophica bacterium]|nr:helix-turn-helix transcriptional regulator [Candidatus Omnitrophota bacterium]
MKKTNWHWDLQIPLEKIRGILANDQDPQFVSLASRLLVRSGDPEEVFSFISPMAFCRRFYAMKKEISKDDWTKDKAAFWQATYRRYLTEFKQAGVRVRERSPRETDSFTREILKQMRSCRERANLSQKELAIRIRCSQQFVSGVESGREKLTLGYLRKFAEATNSRLDILLQPAGAMTSQNKKTEEEYAGLKRWIESERSTAANEWGAAGSGTAAMEVFAYCPNRVLNSRLNRWHSAETIVSEDTLRFRQDQLRDAMEKSQVHAFGWPIGGVVLDKEEYKPRAFQDGIRAKILVKGESYDYWALRNDLVFYLLKSLFEDMRAQGKIFLDTRVVRTAEAILRVARLYEALHISSGEKVVIGLRYTGLRGRELASADRRRMIRGGKICVEDQSETSLHETLGNIKAKLIELTQQAVSALTVLFDYFPLSQERVIRPLLQEFFKGEPSVQSEKWFQSDNTGR